MSLWYFAHEGRRQGPVPVFELEQLAERGEFDPQHDLVWREGMAEWRPASEFPELEFHFRSDPEDGFPEDPYAAPRSPAPLEPVPEAPALAEIEPGSEPLEVGRCLRRAFTLAKRQLGTLFLIGLLYLVVVIATSLLLEWLDGLAGYEPPPPPASTGNPEFDELLIAAASQTSPASQLLSTFVDVFLGLGLVRFTLNLIDGRTARLSDLFSQYRRLLRGFVAHFLFSLMVGVGLLLLVVPGVYLLLRFGFYNCGIVDRDLGVIDSFRLSSRITRGSKFRLLGLVMLCLLLMLLGGLALGIGLAFALPLVALAWSLAFRFLLHGSRALEDPSP